ncbi:hypothetical protein C8R43DRAFT_1183066 [Mycena crocata]|nr:hypothetical protein C8R43DRAFT_1183066 [Mycena crocata]
MALGLLPKEDEGEEEDTQLPEESLDEQPVPLRRAPAAVPVHPRCGALAAVDDNPWAPFKSQIDWQIARWAKVRGSTSTAFTDLLSINGVTEALGLSYKNSQELNKIIDTQLPGGRPVFKRQEIVVGGEAFDVYFRPIMECVRALYGDPEFAQDLVFAPERHYADADKTIRLYHEIHTAEFWWRTQKSLEKRKPGATMVPIIISTDKTQTTMFRNKAAYPVYMTIGNIPKDIRRKPSRHAYILIGYLPTSPVANLYHACMRKILGPLRAAGVDGVQMASGDGVVRRCHPILSIFAGDYPEQTLVGGVKTGECSTCPALKKADGNATVFTRACSEAGIKPIYHPFWEDLPYVNIYLSITSDVLHQLYQGVIKHLVAWVTEAFGAVEIDARCRRMPPNHNTRLFLKGITTLSRVSGTEHSQMCKILLGLLIDLRLPERQATGRLIRAVKGALDFLYLAQYPMHSSETIVRLNNALKQFHDNKSIFIDLGIRENFNIPKLHNISHYPLHLKLHGTMDNYNTEYTERLHIDLAKDAYRATNRKDEYLQMTLWLERKEKIFRHEKFTRWRCAGAPAPTVLNANWRAPDVLQHRHLQMAKFPSARGVPITALETKYGATYFHDAFARFVVGFQNPEFSKRQIETAANDIFVPFRKLSTFHKIKFWNEDPLGRNGAIDTLDVVHIKPGYTNTHGRIIGGRFDTVIVNDGTGEHSGVTGYRVGQVRVVFTLSEHILAQIFGDGDKPSEHLAYVEWFSKFPPRPDPNHGMYKISRPAERVASIIPVGNIRRSVQLFPEFGPVAPREWKSDTVLEQCTKFYVNPWSDRHAYITIT